MPGSGKGFGHLFDEPFGVVGRNLNSVVRFSCCRHTVTWDDTSEKFSIIDVQCKAKHIGTLLPLKLGQIISIDAFNLFFRLTSLALEISYRSDEQRDRS